MNIFLDTNAIVKLYHHETGTEHLDSFITNNANDLTISISDISLVEFYAAIYRKVRTLELEMSNAEKILHAFDRDCRQYNIFEVNRITKRNAIELLKENASTMSLRTLDALQLSSALSIHQYLPINYFICSDMKLIAVAKKHFTVYNPETNE